MDHPVYLYYHNYYIIIILSKYDSLLHASFRYFPTTISWWLLNIISAGIMCICGELLCMRTELKAIPLTSTPKVGL